PSGEGSGDGPLLSKRALSVTSVAKLFEERFDPMVEHTFGCPVLGGGCCHIVSPFSLSGMLPVGRRYDYAASVRIAKAAGSGRNRPTRHNPGVGITSSLPLAAVTRLLSRGAPAFRRNKVSGSQCFSR